MTDLSPWLDPLATEAHVDLDVIVADPEWASRHRRRVAAPADKAWNALFTAAVDCHPVVAVLVGLRFLPRLLVGKTPPASLRRRTVVDVAPYPIVSVNPGTSVIIAGVDQPWKLAGSSQRLRLTAAEVAAFDAPGWAKMAMEMRIEATPGGCIVSTETRIATTDADSHQAFARYWRLIRIPSGMIRGAMLSTVARTAEQAAAGR